jgi:hypothetical protein
MTQPRRCGAFAPRGQTSAGLTRAYGVVVKWAALVAVELPPI